MNAFYELLKEKDLEKLSIREIAERADMNRGTIYLRYEDKYDLFHHFIELQMEEIKINCANSQSLTKETLTTVFEFFENKKIVFQTILSGVEGSIFFKFMKEQIIQQVMVGETKKGPKEVFISSAIIGVLEWWLLEGELSASDIADTLWPLITQLHIQELVE